MPNLNIKYTDYNDTERYTDTLIRVYSHFLNLAPEKNKEVLIHESINLLKEYIIFPMHLDIISKQILKQNLQIIIELLDIFVDQKLQKQLHIY